MSNKFYNKVGEQMTERQIAKYIPVKNVIYRFRNKGKDELFKFDAMLPDGRYQFINVQYGNNVTMTPARFRYKMRWNSGKKIPLDKQLSIDDVKESMTNIGAHVLKNVAPTTSLQNIENTASEETEENISYFEFLEHLKESKTLMLKKLTALSDDEKVNFTCKVTNSIEYYIAELDKDKMNYDVLEELENVFKSLNWCVA